jgi:hypothetical protein
MSSFASAADLQARMGKAFTPEQVLKANLILAGATAYIRACTDQWISVVADDVITIDAPISDTIWLPQRPVQSVATVKVDGSLTTAWKLRGSRLIKVDLNGCPWATSSEPHEVEIAYTHGFATTDERFDLARDACLSLAMHRLSNPLNLISESVDDYSRTFNNGATEGSEWYALDRALRKQYGRRPRTGSVQTAA